MDGEKPEKEQSPPTTFGSGGSLPDTVLGKLGELLTYEEEKKFVAQQGLDPGKISWISQSVPNAPFDIQSIRQSDHGAGPHFIEVKSTTLGDLSNIYMSKQQIEHMEANSSNSKLVVVVFDSERPIEIVYKYSLEQIKRNFEFAPIKFKLRPLD